MTPEPAAPRKPPRAILLLAVLLAGCLLRLTGLEVHSLWYDEAQLVWEGMLPDLLASLRLDRHPPLSFLAIGWWAGLVGLEDGALRLLPAMVSSAVCLLFAWVSHRVLAPRAALVATALWALSPFHVWYGQELRMYVFVEAGAVLALWGLVLARGGGRGRGAVLVGLGSALALGSHYIGFQAAAVASSLACFDWRRDRRCFWAVTSGAAVGCLVWLPWIVSYVPVQREAPWGYVARAGARNLAELPVRHFLIQWSALPALLVLGVALAVWLALLACGRAALRRGAWLPRQVLAGLLVPLGVLFVLFLWAPPNFAPNYVIALSPMVTLAVVLGFAELDHSWRWSAVLPWLTVVACGLGSVWLRAGNLKEDYRSAVAELAVAFVPGDVVVAVTGTLEGPSQAGLRHYLRDRPDVTEAIAVLGEVLQRLEAGGTVPRLQVIYRVREYALPFLERIRKRMREVHTGEERHWIQHLIFEPR